MQHEIDAEAFGPAGEHMAHAVSTCVHCGFCLPACPTYRELGEEMDSPRGRIVLMKGALEGTLSLDDVQPHIDRCLGCLACTTACPSGVPYGDLLTPFRAHAARKQGASLLARAQRDVLLETLPYPARFAWALRLGRLTRWMAPFLPPSMRAMLALVPPSVPPAQTLPALTPARGARRARVALLAGCAQQVLAPNIGAAAIRVLSQCGVEVIVPPAQGCCGALALHVGDRERARQHARVNVAAFPVDVDAVVTTAAGCGSGMQEYPHLFEGTAEAEAATALAHRTVDVSLFLEQLGVTLAPRWPEPITVAYHDACHLRHAQGVSAEPRALLGRIGNVRLVEILDSDCCGSAGTYNLDQPALAHAFGQRKAKAVLATGASIVASGNIGCLTQLATHLTAIAGADAPRVVHTIELVDEALTRDPRPVPPTT
ncbi:MAG: heterodisulfide reductase-related iron-sulfur binding cluster [Vicinamibacteraceae bacterium]